MNLDCSVFAFAGVANLASVALSQVHSPYWLLTAFVGLDMLQAALTSFCSLVLVLKRRGVRPGNAFHRRRPAGFRASIVASRKGGASRLVRPMRSRIDEASTAIERLSR